MGMTSADVRAFFDGYARAFSARDVEAICDHYQFPVQILSEGSGQVYPDRADMLADMAGFIAAYDRFDLNEAQVTAFAFRRLSDAFGQADVEWLLLDGSGAVIVSFRSTYILRTGGATASGRRPAITGILGHTEDSAWKEFNTPRYTAWPIPRLSP